MFTNSRIEGKKLVVSLGYDQNRGEFTECYVPLYDDQNRMVAVKHWYDVDDTGFFDWCRCRGDFNACEKPNCPGYEIWIYPEEIREVEETIRVLSILQKYNHHWEKSTLIIVDNIDTSELNELQKYFTIKKLSDGDKAIYFCEVNSTTTTYF